MRLSRFALPLCILFTSAASAAQPAPAKSTIDGPLFDGRPSSANDFDFAMYGAVRGKDGNLFFSPVSLREALGIAYLGARGTTAREMSTTFHFDADRANAAKEAKGEIDGWQSARGASQLAIANRLWADQGFRMNADFTQSARDAYGSPVDPIDFAHAPAAARTTINGWVEKQTNDKIHDLLPAPSITSDTRLVITNAIWFKGTWEKTFDAKATRDAPFHVTSGMTANVPTMHQTAVFGIATVPGAKVLEMAYGKSDLAMDVILPDDANGLSNVEASLTAGSFATWTSSLAKRKVAVSFPKFTFTWGGSVKSDLQKLGMKTAFLESAADFSGIGSRKDAGGNLYVSDVFHKAFVAVDEQGTEATAATAVVIARESAVLEPPPVRFDADHPFVFVIRDVKRGRVLFIGRVNNPTG